MIGDATRPRRKPSLSCWPRRELAASPSLKAGYKVLRSNGPGAGHDCWLCQTDGELLRGLALRLVLVRSGQVGSCQESGRGCKVRPWQRRNAMCLVCYLNLIFSSLG